MTPAFERYMAIMAIFTMAIAATAAIAITNLLTEPNHARKDSDVCISISCACYVYNLDDCFRDQKSDYSFQT